MANVIFKRGVQASLPATGQDGIFYLTTDTNRLYVGQGSGKAPQLLNQTVNVVEALANLPTNYEQHPEVAINDFYYCKAENILAVCTKTEGKVIEWTQINPDTNTFINDAGFTEGFVNANKDTLSYTLNLYYNDTTPLISRSFDIKAADLNELIEIPEVEQASVGLQGAEGSSDGTAAITISTTGTGADADKSLHLMGGTDIDLNLATNKQNQPEISINHASISVTKTEAPSTATALTFGDEFVVTEDVTAGSNGHVTAITEKKYKLPAKPTLEELGGVSQDDFNDIITKIANPMIYKGVVNSDAELIIKEANIESGHTYMVGTAGTYDDKEAEPGDLFIWADGAWTYIPAGDDAHIDTQYELQVHADASINLVGSTNSSAPISTIHLVSDTLKVEIADQENSVAINLEWGTF